MAFKINYFLFFSLDFNFFKNIDHLSRFISRYYITTYTILLSAAVIHSTELYNRVVEAGWSPFRVIQAIEALKIASNLQRRNCGVSRVKAKQRSSDLIIEAESCIYHPDKSLKARE